MSEEVKESIVNPGQSKEIEQVQAQASEGAAEQKIEDINLGLSEGLAKTETKDEPAKEEPKVEEELKLDTIYDLEKAFSEGKVTKEVAEEKGKEMFMKLDEKFVSTLGEDGYKELKKAANEVLSKEELIDLNYRLVNASDKMFNVLVAGLQTLIEKEVTEDVQDSFEPAKEEEVYTAQQHVKDLESWRYRNDINFKNEVDRKAIKMRSK